ncbi:MULTISPECIES: hypothetical protein [Metabacillus]|uniref:Uncharacterized protein n=2 Tax=Metabacillus TaxID=2675233 RepID=A0A179SXT8_9BACI|nr:MULTISPECIES: hypothetical protein [Metabacillus]OAS86636.1 hypothetical protein A6K24_03745 [Metabacillus litoralis]QNF29291.1 hypothetical protein HUW50_18480 [Metabacillus sp. KUDC1714]
MSYFTMVLGVIALLVLAISLIYTFRVGRLVSVRKSNLDTQINEKIQDHPYMRNPVFFAYVIAGLVSLAYIFYLAYSISW